MTLNEPDYRALHIQNVVRDFTRTFPWLERIAVIYDRDPDDDKIWVEVTTADRRECLYFFEPGDYDPAIYSIYPEPVEGLPEDIEVDISNENPPEYTSTMTSPDHTNTPEAQLAAEQHNRDQVPTIAPGPPVELVISTFMKALGIPDTSFPDIEVFYNYDLGYIEVEILNEGLVYRSPLHDGYTFTCHVMPADVPNTVTIPR